MIGYTRSRYTPSAVEKCLLKFLRLGGEPSNRIRYTIVVEFQGEILFECNSNRM